MNGQVVTSVGAVLEVKSTGMRRGAVKEVKGMRKSGRVWKNDKKRFSSMCQSKALKTPFKKVMQMRQERKALLAKDAEIREEKKREEESRKQRRREKIERKRQNELKSEITQVIRNSARIKTMSKKQLRWIGKRDTHPRRIC
ncbi:coiled-coil domain-containing protein 86-like isoform X2 [Uloborus diversus]|uniref:coiled-coil domain-containing protein 86-like isoform X1 n=1 Tax=Uloborus diversus TaxID=327109 RepID=UPI00240A67E2|nr:coiled-coil domain-containing protein 86-like isoform X1 [Uloborus diversus]XP_054722098.1 coiled-coil domain-containing protein 86-like isoform X2 [Uloborus diversus]